MSSLLWSQSQIAAISTLSDWAMAARLPMCDCMRPPRPTSPTRIRSLAPRCPSTSVGKLNVAAAPAATADAFTKVRRLVLLMILSPFRSRYFLKPTCSVPLMEFPHVTVHHPQCNDPRGNAT